MNHHRCSLVLAAVLIGLGAPRAASAQTVMSWLDPRLVRQRPVVDYRLRNYFDESPVRGQDADMNFAKQELSVTAPLCQSDEEQWRLTTQVWSLCIPNDAVLPDTGEPVPDELWDIRLGGGYGRKLDEGKVLGIHATVGSASDRPFAGAGQTALSATAFFYWPDGEHAGWLTYLAGQSQLDGSGAYAFPGFGRHIDTERFQALLGLPVIWTRVAPAPGVAVQGLLMPSRVMLDGNWKVLPRVALFATYDWEWLNFVRYDRAERGDTLYYMEQRLYGGVEWNLADNVQLILGAGYGFDRRFYESDDPFCGSQTNRFSVGDGAIAFVKLHLTF